ncbi:MAG: rod shape-determining protein MreC [Anaerolineales bacterium]|nr:rod shape-determining protein MreC [Anaerolineales bacterium]
MTKFQTRSVLVVTLVLVSIGLLVFGQMQWFEPVRSALLWPLSALQRPLAAAWNGASRLLRNDPDTAALQQRVAELEAEIDRLNAEIIRLRQKENEWRIATGLLEYAGSQPENTYLPANLVGRSTSPFLNFLIFDKGSDSGIQRGMPVVTDKGLVGRVVEVTSTACKVLPITDPESAVAARLLESREQGVVVGRLGGGLEMQFITQQTRIRPGEVVVTSGLGGVYPPGIVIGTVTAVQQLTYEVQQRAEIAPAVDYNLLEKALIITNFQPADFSPFFRSTPAP